MKKTINFILCFIFFWSQNYGQEYKSGTEIFVIAQDSKLQLLRGRCMLDKPDLKDSCNLRITYLVHYSKNQSVLRDRAILQIGTTYSLFYGLTTFRIDHNITLNAAGKQPIRYPDLDDELIDYTILKDEHTRNMTCTHHIPFTKNHVLQYDDSDIVFTWEITNDTLTIANHICYKARTTHGGRQWNVWYTPEIPISNGPWKFFGLPGLILQAADMEHSFLFSCIEIKKTNEPLITFVTKSKTISKKQWLDFERRIYQSPVNTFGNMGEKIFFIRDKQNKLSRLDESWSIPYNPIELE